MCISLNWFKPEFYGGNGGLDNPLVDGVKFILLELCGWAIIQFSSFGVPCYFLIPERGTQLNDRLPFLTELVLYHYEPRKGYLS
jgi:hypothetical protein